MVLCSELFRLELTTLWGRLALTFTRGVNHEMGVNALVIRPGSLIRTSEKYASTGVHKRGGIHAFTAWRLGCGSADLFVGVQSARPVVAMTTLTRGRPGAGGRSRAFAGLAPVKVVPQDGSRQRQTDEGSIQKRGRTKSGRSRKGAGGEDAGRLQGWRERRGKGGD